MPRTLVLIQVIALTTAVTYTRYRTESKAADGKDCLTDCVNSKCVTKLKDVVIKSCFPGTVPAPRYYTTNYKQQTAKFCETHCGRYGGKDYDWCYVGDTIEEDKWDYCSSVRGVTQVKELATIEGHYTCLDDCAYRGYSYQWCNTVFDSWGKCETISYFQAYTYQGQKCLGSCEKRGENYNWCYTDSSKNWDYCAPPAEDTTLVTALFNMVPHLFTTDGRRLYNVHALPKYVIPEVCDIGPGFVDNFWAYLRGDNLPPNLVVERPNVPDNSVQEYAFLRPNEENASPIMPLGVRAVITADNLRAYNNRQYTPRSVHRNLARLGSAEHDDAGHIIASCNGGPTAVYNFIPQEYRINRGIRTSPPTFWRRSERMVNQFVQGTTNYVHQNMIVVYNDIHESFRPAGIVVTETYYFGNGTVAHQCGDVYYPNDIVEGSSSFHFKPSIEGVEEVEIIENVIEALGKKNSTIFDILLDVESTEE